MTTLAIELLSIVAPPADAASPHGRCAVTGRHLTQPGIPMRQVFSDNFADYNLLRLPQSQVVDPQIAEALSNHYLRYKSWIITQGTFQSVDRPQIVQLITTPPVYPWGCYAALGMRRQGGLLTAASTSPQNAVIQFDRFAVSLATIQAIYPRVLTMAINGFKRDELAQLQLNRGAKTFPHPPLMQQWCEYVRWAKPHQQGAAYQLAVWLLPGKDQLPTPEANHE